MLQRRQENRYARYVLVVGLLLWMLSWAGAQGEGGGPVPPNDSVVIANVLGYAIVNSRVESIQPEQVLHALWLELLRSDDVPGLPNFSRNYVGTIVKVLSKEGLSPYLFGKTIQAHVELVGDERGSKFWIREINIQK